MERMPDRQPASAAPGTRATRPQSLTVAIVVAYGALLFFVISNVASAFGVW